MSFILAGALSGLGGSLKEWGDATRKEIADEKKRQQQLADQKELIDYRIGAKGGARGGGGRGGSGGSGGSGGNTPAAEGEISRRELKKYQKEDLLRANGLDPELDMSNPKAIALISQAEKINGLAKGKITSGELIERTNASIVNADRKTDGGMFGEDGIEKNTGEFLGMNTLGAAAGDRRPDITKPPVVPTEAPSGMGAPAAGSGFDAVLPKPAAGRPSQSIGLKTQAAPAQDEASLIADAQRAVTRGASVEAVRARLKSMGIDPSTVQ